MKLRAAKNYKVSYIFGTFQPRKNMIYDIFAQEWKEAASVLDDFLGFDEWKSQDEDPYYDWKLVRKVNIHLILHLSCCIY